MPALVSLCIPAYQQPGLLQRCLQSIVAQDYPAIEVVITDDTPGAEVSETVEKFTSQLSILYVHHGPSLGTPANWNAALSKATGDILMLLHHDDWLAHADSITKAVQHLEQNPSASFLFGRSMYIDSHFGDRHLPNPIDYFNWLYSNPAGLLIKNVLGPPGNVMIRKTVTQRYNLQYKWLVDLEFYLQVLQAGHHFVYMDDPLIKVGIHDAQMTNYVHDNKVIIVKENLLFAMQYFKNGIKDWRLYDHYWRLMRNHMITENEVQRMEIDIKHLPDFLRQMIRQQAAINPGVLNVGIASKAIMYYTFLRQ